MSKSTSPRVVKGMPSVELDRAEFGAAIPPTSRIRCSTRRPPARLRARHRLAQLTASTTKPAHARGRAGFADPTSSCRSTGSRRAPRSRSRKRARGPGAAAPRPPDQRLDAQRPDLPGEMSKTFRLAQHARNGDRGTTAATSTSSTSSRLASDTAASSIRARPACRRRCRCATGRARAIRITRWARRTTG